MSSLDINNFVTIKRDQNKTLKGGVDLLLSTVHMNLVLGNKKKKSKETIGIESLDVGCSCKEGKLVREKIKGQINDLGFSPN